jgi:aminopeptidase N
LTPSAVLRKFSLGEPVMTRIIFIALSLSLASCNFFVGKKPPRAARASLSKSYAEMRSQNISNVTYQLKFDLTKSENFQGAAALHFDLENLFYLTLDFVGGDVQFLTVNGHKVVDFSYNGFFIEIPEEHLNLGRNSILVQYTHDYSKNGTGLYRYVDPLDQRTYLYSMLEPYYANRVFPCFDQPDLKAQFSMQVLAPKDWHVVTSVREREVTDLGADRQWIFPESARFSTYTFSLHAGEYKIWEDIARTKNHQIPLRLMARQSLASDIQTADWFTWTKQGFNFFESYFSTAYPYKKYDQLIVPDFNYGAMENVAAVTFSEDRFVTRGEKTRQQRRRLASTLFHEMAHMWFGNLVTMKWWDDLWLNESFATYSAHVGLVQATEFTDNWKVFNGYKQRAYQQDQSVITHPVAQDCPHTDAAFANFDAITYTKGASVLKQLSFYLGDKTYRQALRKYFSDFANQNKVLSDFMATMETVSEKDLADWETRWLKTAMLNQVEVFYTCRRGRINHFEIYQTGTKDYPMLRTHKTRIALFRKSGGVFKLNRSISVEYSGGRTELTRLHGVLCPDIVHPNFQDHDYVVVNFDKKSLKNIKSSLSSLQNSFLRGVIWSDLWGMVLNQKMSLDQYLEIVEFNGLMESEMETLNRLFTNVETILKKYYPRVGQPWADQRQVWVKFFEQAIITKIYQTIQEPEVQRYWFSYLLQVTESPNVLTLLQKVVKGHLDGLPLNFSVGQDLRWDILASLAANRDQESLKLLAKEKKRDPSKRGEMRALYAETLYPSQENKEQYWGRLLANKDVLSFATLRTIMSGLFPASQQDLHRGFVAPFFKKLKSLKGAKEDHFAATYTQALVPTFCDQQSSVKISRFLKSEKRLSEAVVKALQAARFENQRCYKMRRLLKNQQQSQQNLSL